MEIHLTADEFADKIQQFVTEQQFWRSAYDIHRDVILIRPPDSTGLWNNLYVSPVINHMHPENLADFKDKLASILGPAAYQLMGHPRWPSR